MNHIFIEPLDVWLFRDGRPFAAGSDHRAESLFPPFPSTALGAIRTSQLFRLGWPQQSGKMTDNILAKKDDLTLSGPFVARREQINGKAQFLRYYPQPADSYVENGDVKPIAPPAALPSGVRTGLPMQKLQALGFGEEHGKMGPALWLSESELLKYLTQKSGTGVSAHELFTRENRMSIGMENAFNTVRNGALYEVQFIRPNKDVGLMVGMDGYDWSNAPAGVLQLGGESRSGVYETVQADSWPTRVGQPIEGNFKVYFATPAYFEGGWQPQGGDWSDFFGPGVELASAAIGRYASIGGFDLAADPNHPGAHRPSRRYVPAGSVYYFTSKQTSLRKASLTDYGSEMGLGQILIQEKEW